jgi:hypothetical protein
MCNRREPKGCLGRVFNFKLDSFASYQHNHFVLTEPIVDMKTRPRVRPVN